MKTYIIPSEAMEAIKKSEFTACKFIFKGNYYYSYSKVMQYLLSDRPVLINRETGRLNKIKRNELLYIYALAFNSGRSKFLNYISVDASENYLIDNFNEYYNGWKKASEEVSVYLQKSQIIRIGFTAGCRFEFTESIKKSLKLKDLFKHKILKKSDIYVDFLEY